MTAFHTGQQFEPAASCLRVRLVTAISFGTVLAGAVLLCTTIPEARQLPFIAAVAVALPLYVAFLWFAARIWHYSLTEEELRVRRLLYSPRFRLEGLSSVERVSEPLKDARKIIGNDGLGAISGRFKNKSWGSFRAYLTDPQEAVLLRWKDGRVVILSPAKTQVFVDVLRKRLH